MTAAKDAQLVERMKDRAAELGFTLFGVAGPEPSRHMDSFGSWLAEGRHGEMTYLAREESVTRRADLSGTMDSVRSVVIVGHEYCQDDAVDRSNDPSRAIIARYARGDDYHDVVKAKLLELLSWLDETEEGGVEGRPYVDTGPILERELAQRAGLGWFGRNTMLIDPHRGSYFFLGVLLLDLDLPPSGPFEEDRCGTCRACLDACPTAALLGRDEAGAPVIDARRCISYLTIELRGPIPVELRPGIGNRVFGCDVCQEVCPWNERFAEQSTEPAYSARSELDGPASVELAELLLSLSGKGFTRAFAGSPVLRTGRNGLLRNACVALGNWGSEEALPVLARALEDRAPLARGHAAWALGRVGTPEATYALSQRELSETDVWVRGEIEAAMSPPPSVTE